MDIKEQTDIINGNGLKEDTFEDLAPKDRGHKTQADLDHNEPTESVAVKPEEITAVIKKLNGKDVEEEPVEERGGQIVTVEKTGPQPPATMEENEDHLDDLETLRKLAEQDEGDIELIEKLDEQDEGGIELIDANDKLVAHDSMEDIVGIAAVVEEETTKLESAHEIIDKAALKIQGVFVCYSCGRTQPIVYSAAEGSICLNCVQVELRSIMARIRERFFGRSLVTREIIEETLKGDKDDGQLSMLETLQMAKDLLNSYIAASDNGENLPVLDLPYLAVCDRMDPQVKKLTWSQMQNVAHKMKISPKLQIDLVAKEICARVKRCDDCNMLTILVSKSDNE